MSYLKGLATALNKKKRPGVGLYSPASDNMDRARNPGKDLVGASPDGRFEEDTRSSMNAEDSMQYRKKTKKPGPY